MRKQMIFKRILAMLLVLVMLIQETPVNVLAETIQDFASDTGGEEMVISCEEEEEIHITAEIKEERTETTKTFLMSDGSYRIVSYDQPVHVEVSEGTYEEIDNTFVQEEEGAGTLSFQDDEERTVYRNKNGKNRI